MQAINQTPLPPSINAEIYTSGTPHTLIDRRPTWEPPKIASYSTAETLQTKDRIFQISLKLNSAVKELNLSLTQENTVRQDSAALVESLSSLPITARQIQVYATAAHSILYEVTIHDYRIHVEHFLDDDPEDVEVVVAVMKGKNHVETFGYAPNDAAAEFQKRYVAQFTRPQHPLWLLQ